MRVYNPQGDVLNETFGWSAAQDNGNLSTWDASGSGTPLFNRSYTYDPVNRLATMSSPADPYGCYGLSWTYDAWGNRNAQTVTGGSCPAFSNSADIDNHLGAPYQYDAAGNLTNDGAHTYTYDAENRITQVDGGSTASYVYNGGERGHRRRFPACPPIITTTLWGGFSPSTMEGAAPRAGISVTFT
jgi:hypothetical protein